jgi:hypothetical protein
VLPLVPSKISSVVAAGSVAASRAHNKRLMVVAENYKGARNDAVLGTAMKLLGSSRLSMDDQRALFLSARYEGVEIAEERRRG